MKKNILLILSLWIILSFILITLYFTYFTLLKPAYLSYKIDCFPEQTEQILSENNLEIAGFYNSSNNTITIYDESNCVEVNKHEIIHRVQNIQNRVGSCQYPLTVFRNELEAYFGEKYPDFIFNYFYLF